MAIGAMAVEFPYYLVFLKGTVVVSPDTSAVLFPYYLVFLKVIMFTCLEYPSIAFPYYLVFLKVKEKAQEIAKATGFHTI